MLEGRAVLRETHAGGLMLGGSVQVGLMGIGSGSVVEFGSVWG